MSRKNDLEKLITEHVRRLQKLNEQKAAYGLSTEPHVLLEIENIETEIGKLKEELATLGELSHLNPYRGLAAFRETDRSLFFGREQVTAQLLDSVQQKPLVTVLGPSGSGKSSVVFAGLIPCLRDQGQWLIASLRPGDDPCGALAAALLPLLEPTRNEIDLLMLRPKMTQVLSQGKLTLSVVAHRILEKTSQANQLLLVVDQFEELYTLCTNPKCRQEFINIILQPVSCRATGADRPVSLHLVLTLRADFMGQALTCRPLADAMRDADVKLGPMMQAELQRAIETPAEIRQVSFQAGLVDRILVDVSAEPGNLPLLEFALTNLWEQQSRGELTHDTYNTIGGVKGALSGYADEVFGELSEDEQERARRVFVQMVRPGEGTENTRRLAHRDELSEADWQLVQQLAGRRLLVTDLDPNRKETAEVIHEALIQDWAQLQQWMQKDRVFRAWQERLRAAVQQWQASQQDEGALLRGVPLAEAEEWLGKREPDLSPDEQTFIRTSIELREKELAAEQARHQREVKRERALAQE